MRFGSNINIMTEKFIDKIQKKILELLPKGERQKKALLLVDCCSELSRLVASWINDVDKTSHQVILKGDKVCDTNKSHDIVASIRNDKVYLIDPTIWQFFPDEDSIFIGKFGSLDEAIDAAAIKYGGHWQKSEDLTEISLEEKNKWLNIIKENIEENTK